MSIFNSLGSNYNFDFVLKSFFSDSTGQTQKLKNFLEEKYQGKAILTYKGREALTLALKVLNLSSDSCVVINGFTCYAVFKAVETAGLTPICLDLDSGESDLNFSPETLRKAVEGNEKIKVVVVQNTLGYPCNIENIAKFCKEKNIILIEDLAHCIGSRYENGERAGRMGDFVTLSFSQDKVIDSVSGGALIIRNKKLQKLASPGTGRYLASQGEALWRFLRINSWQQFKDKLYPLLTFKIRKTYDFGLGKLLHYVLKDLNLLSKPMQEGLYNFYSLPEWYCNLAFIEFGKLKEQLNHRKEIAKIYAKKINRKILNKNITDKISLSSNLRFPIFIENRRGLIKFLKQDKIFVSDIWYDSVAPECPNAVEISRKILNLPTHINVSKKDALRIAEKINGWLKIKNE